MKSTTTWPRIKFWDLETSHNLVAAFNLYSKDYIPHDNVITERYIICGSYMGPGDKHPRSVSVLDDKKRFKKDPHDDYFVVKTLRDELEDTDIIIAHNGDSYDSKFLNGRIIKHGLKPLPPIKSIDTLKIARNQFLFNSNRLDYLGKYLGCGQKKKTTHGLWLKALTGNVDAIKEMVEYNGYDCILLRDVFNRMLGYVPSLNLRLYGRANGCPKCGSDHVQRRGVHVAETRTYQRFQCMECGGWYKEGKPESGTSARGL